MLANPDFGDAPLQFVMKLASICNLNCSYCYVYNKGDETWKQRPPFMTVDVIEAVIDRILRHVERSGQRKVRIIFHGGEPCLIGADAFDLVCQRLRWALREVGHVHLSLQTNGTTLDDEWAAVLRKHGIYVGLSIDGDKPIHDRHRVTHGGRGSFDRIVRGLECLRRGDVGYDLMTVIPLGEDGARIYHSLAALDPRSINFLLPDYTHDDIAAVRASHGPTPCADFLIPAFDAWWNEGQIDLRVGLFWSIARLVMGAESDVDLLGNQPLRYVFVETDGEIQPLDVLRVCGHGFNATSLNVMHNDFSDLARDGGMAAEAVFRGMPVSGACHGCREQRTCAGGYLPHRFSRERGFDNASVWCADLYALFGHVRHRLGVSEAETRERRMTLAQQAAA
ncbi:radical SAM protein [Sphingobium nicotianae]|uniref:Radical SAM protein n=1 Tax=Sphingobium nicotianae TaxID=2782607 RepID=A0A9X1IS71_9SPHN|nr:radical SAM protein [Sphingobium nicotianae]MBT2188039.1 radical SAM protein [Sphingobium nicotianae]